MGGVIIGFCFFKVEREKQKNKKQEKSCPFSSPSCFILCDESWPKSIYLDRNERKLPTVFPFVVIRRQCRTRVRHRAVRVFETCYPLQR